MRRSLPALLSVLLASVALLGGSYFVVKQVWACHLAGAGDDLEWLRREFRLNDAELQHIRRLHEGYLPKCRAMCDRIAAKKKALQAALDAGQGLTPDAEQKLAEVAALRAQCQAQMLRHFVEVSRAMPPAQGRRYLTEMQRLTLGFHDQTEQSMSESAGRAHGHD
jgi:hypothetical protein